MLRRLSGVQQKGHGTKVPPLKKMPLTSRLHQCHTETRRAHAKLHNDMWQLAIPGLNSYQVANHSLGTYLVATDTPRATPWWAAQVRPLGLLTGQISTTTQWPCRSQLQTIHLPARCRGPRTLQEELDAQLETCKATVVCSGVDSTGQMARWQLEGEQRRRQGWCK